MSRMHCLTAPPLKHPAGYPLEVHTVTTSDGVVLTMERIPRPGCGRVAFFLHGILDTSLTWVSSGVTGSQVRPCLFELLKHVFLTCGDVCIPQHMGQQRRHRRPGARVFFCLGGGRGFGLVQARD
jgi:hypothetical protein